MSFLQKKWFLFLPIILLIGLLSLQGVRAVPGDVFFNDTATGTLTNNYAGDTANFVYGGGYLNTTGNTAGSIIYNTTGSRSTGVYELRFVLNDSGTVINNGEFYFIGLSNSTAGTYIVGFESGLCNDAQSTYRLSNDSGCPPSTNDITRTNGQSNFSMVVSTTNGTAYYYRNSTLIGSRNSGSGVNLQYVMVRYDTMTQYKITNITFCDTNCTTTITNALTISTNNSVNGSTISGFCTNLTNSTYQNYQCTTGYNITWNPNTTIPANSSLYLNLTNATMFNGSAQDNSPNNIQATLNGKTLNTATLYGNPVLNTSSSDTGFTFDGTTTASPGGMRISNDKNPVAQGIITNQFTIRGVVFVRDLMSSDRVIGGQYAAAVAASEMWGISLVNGNFQARASNGTVTGSQIDGITAQNNTAYNVTGTYNSTHVCLYINGAIQGSCSTLISGNINNLSTLNFTIGARPFGLSSISWNGTIYSVDVWNRSLNSTEVALLETSRLPPIGQNLIYSYHFELNNITAGASLNTTADTNYLTNGSTTGEGAYYFDGTNDYLNLGDVLDPVDSQGYSFCSVIESEQNGALQYVVSKYPGSAPEFDLWKTSSNIYSAVFRNVSVNNPVSMTSSYTSSSPAHVCVVLSTTGLQSLYFNGEFNASSQGATIGINNAANFVLGCRTNGANCFNGSISHVQVYGRALSDWEIRDLYNRQSLDFGNYNVTVYNMSGYFNQTQSYTWNSTQSLTIPTYQALLSITARQLFTNNSISTFNVTNNLAFNSTSASTLLIPANNGSNNLQTQVLGNYSKNETCAATLLSTVACEFEDIYDNQFTINATESDGSQLTTYTMTVRNQTLGGTLYQNTTSTAIVYNLLQGYHYNFTLNKSGYNTQTVLLPANASTNTYTFNSSVITLRFTFRDEVNQSIINGTNITLGIVDSTGAESTYTTSTGTLNITDFFPSGDYTFRYGATGYSYRDYYYTLSEADTNFTFYLLSENDYTPGVVEVRNYDGSVVAGAIITLRRYYGNTSTPSIVQMATTQTDGSAVMVAEAVTGFYTWQVEVDGVTRYDTTVPELLAIEADGLWHKTFILDRTGTAVANPNTGFLYAFTPTGTLLNNTAYNLTFSINSTYWNITSCTLTIYNVSNNATLGTNNTFCGDSSVSITTPNTGSVRAVATITTEYFTNTYTFIWPIDSQATSGFTLKDWLDDIEGFSGAGFNNFGRFLIAVLVMVAIVFSLNRTTDLINSGEEILLLITVLILFFSYINWMNLGIPNLPFEIVNQYGIAFIMSFWTVMSFWRREGVAQ